jgi:HPt (histidine-containing phosphotransfer) domain-containing protein
MIDLHGVVDIHSAPPLAPNEQAIDLDHLSRMTQGERNLEREVLQLFDRQATMLTVRMREAPPAVIAASAHTLKGSARGIGAWRVATAAEAVELSADNDAKLENAVRILGASVNEAKAAIAELLRAH